ncbi:MAG: hypothetical protein H6Q29_933 [Bacteroidetes bacterium]|nr:hypothetical protein [Bacteroidota bacterium]
MIPLLVFYIHVVALSAVFTKRWQEDGTGEGILAVFFMALIFFVGWGISSFVLKLFLDQAGFGPGLDRDALSLLLLTLVEGAFYYVFFSRGGGAHPSGTTGPSPSM